MVLPRFMPHGRVDCRSIKYRLGVADGSRLAGVSSAGGQGQGCRGWRSPNGSSRFIYCRSDRVCALRSPVAPRREVRVASTPIAISFNITDDCLVEIGQNRKFKSIVTYNAAMQDEIGRAHV